MPGQSNREIQIQIREIGEGESAGTYEIGRV